MLKKFQNNLSFEEIEIFILKYQIGNFSAIPQNAQISSLSKGIYFWYCEIEGLNNLSQYLSSRITITEHVVKLNDKVLIYIGTAGAKKTENNLGSIRQRLLWHISTKHRPSAISSGTLSTLRTTLGSLLNHDLILSNGIQTEVLINNFMKDFLSVAYLEYHGDPSTVIGAINEDEKFLIKTLKPLLNIKNNPNARLEGHPTKTIKERRILINKASKLSLKI